MYAVTLEVLILDFSSNKDVSGVPNTEMMMLLQH